jgi:hypothetical protein
MNKTFFFILSVIVCFLITIDVRASDAPFNRIKQSLTQREAGWMLIETNGLYKSYDGSKQMGFRWTNGEEEVSTTVVLHKSLKAAKDQFRKPRKGEPSVNGFSIAGIGDEAYVFPPIILNQDGPYNLRLRKARYEIWMNAKSKETLKRCAQYIIDAISETNKVK